MTQEEKRLLLNDLCTRLPYGVNGLVTIHITMSEDITSNRVIDGKLYDRFANLQDSWYDNIPSIKPYLRPMSSMTEEEMDELYTAMDWYGEIDESGNVYTKGQEKVYRETFYEYTDWLNAHHFDYRGLIPMGLALEAPEGMYNL